jgi:hypothetical protein
MHVEIAGANPLLPSPDIDVKLDMIVQTSAGSTSYRGLMFGDAFPNAEAFVVGRNDQATMLHTFTTSGDRNSGPFELLPGDNNRPMGGFFRSVKD